MRIAQVGAHGSEFDFKVLFHACLLADIRLSDLLQATLDMIDLRDGRDFLKERHTYDLVILTYIFRLSPSEFKYERNYPIIGNCPEFKTSELHSSSNWQRRLIETQAEMILVFGCFETSEVTGEYLEKLNGYKDSVLKQQSGTIWKYRRE